MNSRAFLWALASTACASSQHPTSSRTTRRFVLVADVAALRTSSPSVSSGPALPTVPHGPLAFRRVRTRGNDLVEVETVARPERQCAPTIVPPPGMRLRFVVPVRALGLAVVRPFHRTGPEGSLSIAIGTPVREDPATSALEVTHAGVRIVLHEAPTVARWFGEPHAEPRPARAERLAPGTRAVVPGGSVRVEDTAQVPVLLRSSMQGGSRVVVATPCVRFEALVPHGAVLPVLDTELGDASPVRLPRWELRAGALLHWPDRSLAGRTVATVPLFDTGRLVGDLRCFRIPLQVQGTVLDPPPELDVCALSQDLTAP